MPYPYRKLQSLGDLFKQIELLVQYGTLWNNTLDAMKEKCPAGYAIMFEELDKMKDLPAVAPEIVIPFPYPVD